MTFLEDVTVIISIMFALGLVVVLIKEYLEKRIRLLWLLIVSIALGAFDRLLGFTFQRGVRSFNLLFLGFTTFIISMYLMYLFFDLFEHPVPSGKSLAMHTFFLGYNVAFIMVAFPLILLLGQAQVLDFRLFNNPPAKLTATEFQFLTWLLLGSVILFSIGIIIFSLVMPIQVILILNRIRKRFPHGGDQKAYRYMLIGFIIYLAGAYMGNIGIIARILEIIGQGLILYAFLSNKSVLISAHRLDNLLIVNESGLVLLNYAFPTTKIRADELLLSGILSALTSSMQEIMQSEQNMKSIQLADLHLTMRMLPGNARVILISERVSRFILEALDKFVNEFERQFRNELTEARDGFVIPSKFEKAKEVVERIFLIKGTALPSMKIKRI